MLTSLQTNSLFGSHEFAYEAVLRHVGDLNPGASIRHVASEFRHCCTYIWRIVAFAKQLGSPPSLPFPTCSCEIHEILLLPQHAGHISKFFRQVTYLFIANGN